MVVVTANLACASWYGNGQLCRRRHLAIQYFAYGLSAIKARFPRLNDSWDMAGNPFDRERTAVHQHHNCRYTRGCNGLDKLLLTTRQRQFVTVAILSTGLLFPMIAHRIFANDKYGKLCLFCPADGFGYLLFCKSLHIAPNVLIIDGGIGVGCLYAFEDSRHIFLRLLEAPVAQYRLIVGVMARYKYLLIAAFLQGQQAVFVP